MSAANTDSRRAHTRQQQQRGSGVQSARREPSPDVVAAIIRDLDRMPSESARLVGRDLGELVAVAKDVPQLNSHLYSAWVALTHERRRGDMRPMLEILERWARRHRALSSAERDGIVRAVIRAERRRAAKLKQQKRIAAERELEDAIFASSEWAW